MRVIKLYFTVCYAMAPLALVINIKHRFSGVKVEGNRVCCLAHPNVATLRLATLFVCLDGLGRLVCVCEMHMHNVTFVALFSFVFGTSWPNHPFFIWSLSVSALFVLPNIFMIVDGHGFVCSIDIKMGSTIWMRERDDMTEWLAFYKTVGDFFSPVFLYMGNTRDAYNVGEFSLCKIYCKEIYHCLLKYQFCIHIIYIISYM